MTNPLNNYWAICTDLHLYQLIKITLTYLKDGARKQQSCDLIGWRERENPSPGLELCVWPVALVFGIAFRSWVNSALLWPWSCKGCTGTRGTCTLWRCPCDRNILNLRKDVLDFCFGLLWVKLLCISVID